MNLERMAWAERMGLTERAGRSLRNADLYQLSHCKSDEARRLLLKPYFPFPRRYWPHPHLRNVGHGPRQITAAERNLLLANAGRISISALAGLMGIDSRIVHRWARELGLNTVLPPKRKYRRRARPLQKKPPAGENTYRLMELARKARA